MCLSEEIFLYAKERFDSSYGNKGSLIEKESALFHILRDYFKIKERDINFDKFYIIGYDYYQTHIQVDFNHCDDEIYEIEFHQTGLIKHKQGTKNGYTSRDWESDNFNERTSSGKK